MGFLSKQREEDEFFSEMKYCQVGAAIGAIGGVVIGGLMGGGGGDAPNNNPGMIASADATKEVAEIQAKTAGEYLDFYKKQYEELKPIMTDVYKSQISMAESNQRRADEYSAYEKSTYRPLEQKLVADATNFNTDAKREELARTASADVSQAFGVARGQQNRQLAAAGLRPDSNRFAALNNNLLVQEALGKAGSQNKARTDAEGLGYARMMDATSLGRNLSSNASTAYGVSLNAGNSAVNNAQAGANLMGQGYTGASNMYSQASNSYGTAGNIYGQDFSNRMTGYQAQVSQDNAKMQAIGSLAGNAAGWYMTKKADGGAIHKGPGGIKGPGGPVDDKIPALLSDGEYVLPADTVKAIGKDKLDKVVKKSHTPAEVQRKRKALKGKA